MKIIYSGIYRIRNTITNKSYYGSSEDLEYRKNKHFKLLELNNHGNIREAGLLDASRNGQKTGSLGISVKIDNEYNSYIEFDYLLNGKPVKYTHRIEFFPCHYGNIRYYFICRETGKRVTALYFVGGYYASRHYHRMAYQCSRDHKSHDNLLHRYWNLERKAEYQKEHGHPRKANKLFIKAYRYQEADLQQLSAWIVKKETDPFPAVKEASRIGFKQ